MAGQQEEGIRPAAIIRYTSLGILGALFVLLYINQNAEESRLQNSFVGSSMHMYKTEQCQEDELKSIRTTCCSDPDLPVLGGVDVVELFSYTDDKHIPGLGDPSLAAILPTRVGNFKFLFLTEENRAKFLVNPWQYAPAWGGFCAMGIPYESQYFTSTARDRLGPNVDLSTWTIVNGRLYFFGGEGPKLKFLQSLPDAISYGDAHWSNMFGGVYDGHFDTNCFHRQEFFDTLRGVKSVSDDGRDENADIEDASFDSEVGKDIESEDRMWAGHKIVKNEFGIIVEVDGIPVAASVTPLNPVDESLYEKYAAEKSLWRDIEEPTYPTPVEFLSQHSVAVTKEGLIAEVDGILVISNKYTQQTSLDVANSPDISPVVVGETGGSDGESSYSYIYEDFYSYASEPAAPNGPAATVVPEPPVDPAVPVADDSPSTAQSDSWSSQDASSDTALIKARIAEIKAWIAQVEAAFPEIVDSGYFQVDAVHDDGSSSPVYTYPEQGNRRRLDSASADDSKTAGHRVMYCQPGHQCQTISKNAYKDDLKKLGQIFNRDKIVNAAGYPAGSSTGKSSGGDANNDGQAVFAPSFPLSHLEKAPKPPAIFFDKDIGEQDLTVLAKVLGEENIAVADGAVGVSVAASTPSKGIINSLTQVKPLAEQSVDVDSEAPVSSLPVAEEPVEEPVAVTAAGEESVDADSEAPVSSLPVAEEPVEEPAVAAAGEESSSLLTVSAADVPVSEQTALESEIFADLLKQFETPAIPEEVSVAEEPAAVVDESALAPALEEAAPISPVALEPVPASFAEEPASLVDGTALASVFEEPAPISPVGQEPAPMVEEASAPVAQEPAPMVVEEIAAPAPVSEPAPIAPVVDELVVEVAEDEFANLLQQFEEPAPTVVEEAVAPALVSEPAAVAAEPAPIVEEIAVVSEPAAFAADPAPIVEEIAAAPSPISESAPIVEEIAVVSEPAAFAADPAPIVEEIASPVSESAPVGASVVDEPAEMAAAVEAQDDFSDLLKQFDSLTEPTVSSPADTEPDVPASPVESKDSTWIKYMDTASGLPFYYNTQTRESSWDEPNARRKLRGGSLS